MPSVTPASTGATTSASTTLTASSDNPTGYNLSIDAVDNTLTHTILPDVITPTAGTIAAPAALGDNAWGFNLDNSDDFAAVPLASTATNDKIIKTTAGPTAGDTIDIYFGAKVNLQIPAGTYSGTVNFTLLANPIPPSLPTITSVINNDTGTNVGSAGGNETVTITGTNFKLPAPYDTVDNITDVTIGSAPCTNLAVQSDTTLTCLIPAQPAGTYDVTVSGWGGSYTKTDAFKYVQYLEKYVVETTVTNTTTQYVDVDLRGATAYRELDKKIYDYTSATNGDHPRAADINLQTWLSQYDYLSFSADLVETNPSSNQARVKFTLPPEQGGTDSSFALNTRKDTSVQPGSENITFEEATNSDVNYLNSNSNQNVHKAFTGKIYQVGSKFVVSTTALGSNSLTTSSAVVTSNVTNIAATIIGFNNPPVAAGSRLTIYGHKKGAPITLSSNPLDDLNPDGTKKYFALQTDYIGGRSSGNNTIMRSFHNGTPNDTSYYYKNIWNDGGTPTSIYDIRKDILHDSTATNGNPAILNTMLTNSVATNGQNKTFLNNSGAFTSNNTGQVTGIRVFGATGGTDVAVVDSNLMQGSRLRLTLYTVGDTRDGAWPLELVAKSAATSDYLDEYAYKPVPAIDKTTYSTVKLFGSGYGSGTASIINSFSTYDNSTERSVGFGLSGNGTIQVKQGVASTPMRLSNSTAVGSFQNIQEHYLAPGASTLVWATLGSERSFGITANAQTDAASDTSSAAFLFRVQSTGINWKSGTAYLIFAERR